MRLPPHWRHVFSAGRNEDSVEIPGFCHFFVSRNPRGLRPEPSSLVSTSFTHSGDYEDSGDPGLFHFCCVLESPESSHRTQLQNVCILYCMFSSVDKSEGGSRARSSRANRSNNRGCG